MKAITSSALYVLVTAVSITLIGCQPKPSPQPPTPPPSPTQPTNTPPPSASIPVPPTPPAQVPAHTPDGEKELIIRDLKVVNSPRATDPAGKWHIRTLLSNMTPTGGDPSAFTLKWLRTWETPQTVNGFLVRPRPAMRSIVIDPWIAASGQTGKPDDQVQLDWSKAPFRLLAIVSRTDLARVNPNTAESAGEGRFVFGVLNSDGSSLPFTIIFEYSLQANTLGQVRDWAKNWHNLGNFGDFDEAYLTELERITDSYSGRGIAPTRPNGNALNQLRTDEIALIFPWELREFSISPTTGELTPVTTKATPDITFNESVRLAKFINDNEAIILAKAHTIPESFEGEPFLAGSSLNDPPVWNAPGINSSKARHLFALSTCSGCHGRDANLPNFTHIAVRNPNQVAALSGFLTGTTFNDPVSGESITLNDLADRRNLLLQLANVSPTAASPNTLKMLLQRRNRIH